MSETLPSVDSGVIGYGSHTIEYRVVRSERRTLDITVHPDGAVEVIAPQGVAAHEVAARVRRRSRWILTQLAFFRQFAPRTPPRRWVPGETHLYLGRQYRLRLGVPTASARRVRLIRGFFLIDGVAFTDADEIERLVVAWYRERADAVFGRRLNACAQRLGNDYESPSSIQLRTMVTRWASMSAAGRLSLNPDLVRAPVDAIDYVITHELLHRIVPNHGPQFIKLLNRVMPDHEYRKVRLEHVLA